MQYWQQVSIKEPINQVIQASKVSILGFAQMTLGQFTTAATTIPFESVMRMILGCASSSHHCRLPFASFIYLSYKFQNARHQSILSVRHQT
jgi:hypothetical protein